MINFLNIQLYIIIYNNYINIKLYYTCIIVIIIAFSMHAMA